MNHTIAATKWLQEHLDDPDLIVLDVRLKKNLSQQNNPTNLLQIKGARQIDLKNQFSDLTSPFPNTLLSPEAFELACRELGIHRTSKIVVYDHMGIYLSPRVWWMFKIMGHEAIAVLDGGFPEWIAQDYPTETVVNKTYKLGDFAAEFHPAKVKDFSFVQQNCHAPHVLVIDARSADRFNSLAPEPRKEIRSGNIPQSINIPYQRVLRNGRLKSKAELVEVFKEVGLNDKTLVFSCGSGLTACILILAITLVMENEKAVYDGSWTEWAQLTE